MNKIRPWLYIGKYRDTLNTHLLSAYNIKAMLQLAELVEYPNITSLYLPVDDGVPLPDALLRQGGAGISRSTAFAIAALKETEGMTLLEALRLVKRYHPIAMPHPAIWDSLCAYYGEDVLFLDMRTQL